MISADNFVQKVKKYYSFLVDEFDFKLSDEKIRGNVFYEIHYKDPSRIVSISYENIEEYMLVIVYLLENGLLPDYDDKRKTLHISALTRVILPRLEKAEISQNRDFFSHFAVNNDIERRLLKLASELRLCLKHFGLIVLE